MIEPLRSLKDKHRELRRKEQKAIEDALKAEKREHMKEHELRKKGRKLNTKKK